MVVPVRDHAAQQVRASQERAAIRPRSAEGDMVAAAAAARSAINQEALGAEAAGVRLGIQALVGRQRRSPVTLGMDVHHDPRWRGVPARRGLEAAVEATVARRMIAFDRHGLTEPLSAALDGLGELEEGFEMPDGWWQEDVEHAVAGLHAQRAVRTGATEAASGRGSRASRSRAGQRGPRREGSRSAMAAARSAGVAHGSASSGRRKPMGESPGTSSR